MRSDRHSCKFALGVADSGKEGQLSEKIRSSGLVRVHLADDCVSGGQAVNHKNGNCQVALARRNNRGSEGTMSIDVDRSRLRAQEEGSRFGFLHYGRNQVVRVQNIGVPYGSRTRVAAVKDKGPIVIQGNFAAWIALYRI